MRVCVMGSREQNVTAKVERKGAEPSCHTLRIRLLQGTVRATPLVVGKRDKVVCLLFLVEAARYWLRVEDAVYGLLAAGVKKFSLSLSLSLSIFLHAHRFT